MPRIAPSQQIREEIKRVLQGGVSEGQDVTGVLLRLGAQRLAQELLEEDVTDFLEQAFADDSSRPPLSLVCAVGRRVMSTGY